MAFDWGQALQGGLGAGASTIGLTGNPILGGLAGIAGFLGGGKYKKPKPASKMGITPIDLQSEIEASGLLTSDENLATQRNQFMTSHNDNVNQQATRLIAAGVSPQRAFQIANNNLKSNINQFDINQRSGITQERQQLGQSLLPYKMQRDEDILNYNIYRDNYRPDTGSNIAGLSTLALMMLGDKDKTRENFGNFGSTISGLFDKGGV